MYTPAEVADIVWVYARSNGSGAAARREYQRLYPERATPNARTFSNIFQRLREGTIFRNTAALNQPQRRIDPIDEERVLSLFRENPNMSSRRGGQLLGMSHWSVWSILNQDAQHPYHILQVQELLDTDKPKRAEFSRYLLEQDIENGLASNILWTDESLFTKDGQFNTHNQHTWSHVNPRTIKETKSQFRFTVNVWAGIWRNRLIGPHIFEGSLNGQKYFQFLRHDLSELLLDIPLAGLRDIVYIRPLHKK